MNCRWQYCQELCYSSTTNTVYFVGIKHLPKFKKEKKKKVKFNKLYSKYFASERHNLYLLIGLPLTFDLQLCGVGQVPLWVGHMTFVQSWNISSDRGQWQGTVDYLKGSAGEDGVQKRQAEKDHHLEGIIEDNKEVGFKGISKLTQRIIYLIKIQMMASSNATHFNFFMLLNLTVIFMPDNSWPRVAMGSTAESQWISKQNLYKSRWLLYEGRWS